jgi:protein-S-isoprenylcysteine O-methyltransferase Ste14
MNAPMKSLTGLPPEKRRAIVKWIVQSALGVVGYAAIIFLVVGRLDWVWGWLLVAVLAVFMAAHPILLLPIDPDLLIERGKGSLAEGVKRWDKWLTSLSGVLMMATWVVAGLDDRLGWPGSMSMFGHLLGFLGLILGYALFLWAMTANPFFAEGVRIQTERGHIVATGGPYRFVRHPGYAGVIVAHMATPLLLGSVWALIPGMLLGCLFVARAALEDKTLQLELPGYTAYATETRYRLLPGVW